MASTSSSMAPPKGNLSFSGIFRGAREALSRTVPSTVNRGPLSATPPSSSAPSVSGRYEPEPYERGSPTVQVLSGGRPGLPDSGSESARSNQIGSEAEAVLHSFAQSRKRGLGQDGASSSGTGERIPPTQVPEEYRIHDDDSVDGAEQCSDTAQSDAESPEGERHDPASDTPPQNARQNGGRDFTRDARAQSRTPSDSASVRPSRPSFKVYGASSDGLGARDMHEYGAERPAKALRSFTRPTSVPPTSAHTFSAGHHSWDPLSGSTVSRNNFWGTTTHEPSPTAVPTSIADSPVVPGDISTSPFFPRGAAYGLYAAQAVGPSCTSAPPPGATSPYLGSATPSRAPITFPSIPADLPMAGSPSCSPQGDVGSVFSSRGDVVSTRRAAVRFTIRH